MRLQNGCERRMIISIALVALLLTIIVSIALMLVVWKRKKTTEIQKTNYRAFFIMGISFLPLGLIFMIASFLSDIDITIGLPLFILGVGYTSIGWANRNKWKKKL